MILSGTNEDTLVLMWLSAESSGKYDSPMAIYLEALWLRGDLGDDEVGEVDWSGGHNVRYGRRVMVTDNLGFVNCLTFSTNQDAINFMDDLAAQFYGEED